MIVIEDMRVFLTVLELVSVLATSRKKIKRKLSDVTKKDKAEIKCVLL